MTAVGGLPGRPTAAAERFARALPSSTVFVATGSPTAGPGVRAGTGARTSEGEHEPGDSGGRGARRRPGRCAAADGPGRPSCRGPGTAGHTGAHGQPRRAPEGAPEEGRALPARARPAGRGVPVAGLADRERQVPALGLDPLQLRPAAQRQRGRALRRPTRRPAEPPPAAPRAGTARPGQRLAPLRVRHPHLGRAPRAPRAPAAWPRASTGSGWRPPRSAT